MDDSLPIFISYSRANTAFAAELYRELAALGFTLWRDRSEMEGGRDWWAQIQEAIRESETMVLCMSPQALASPIVAKEWRYARQVGTRVIPVLAAAVDFGGVPRWMQRVDWPDLRPGAPERDVVWGRFVRQLQTPYEARRVPFTVPDLPANLVARPRELNALRALLLDGNHGDPVAITTALQGGGGFGKTVLAQALCHDDDIQHAFSDGVLWIEIGQTPDLASLIDDQIRLLTGAGSGLSDINAMSARLGEILADRDVLLVLDDVWNDLHARPFLGKGRAQLITTRSQDVVLRANAINGAVDVNAMQPAEAVQMLVAGLPAPPADLAPFQALADRCDGWALMLKLAGGYLVEAVVLDGRPPLEALADLERRLDRKGFTYLDRRDAADRNRAISASLELSLERLGPEYRHRYLELAIFPEDTDIPLGVIERLWGATAGYDDIDTEDALKPMARLSLFTRFTLQAAQLHDVVRAYLREQVDLPALHHALLDSYALENWADLPPDDLYMWDQLFYHLDEAGRTQQMVETVQDSRYLARKTWLVSATDVEADLVAAVALDEQLSALHRAFSNTVHLLNRCDNFETVGSTIVSRLYDMNHSALLDGLQRPLILPGQYLPDRPHPALIRTLTGHTSWVNCCAFSHDGQMLASGSGDGTARIWNVATGLEQMVLRGHAGRVMGCAFSPTDDRLLATAAEDATLKIWEVTTGRLLHTLTGHTSWVNDCDFSPDGALLASASTDGTVRLWDTTNWATRQVLEGHPDRVLKCAFSPDGSLLASTGLVGALRVWDAASGELRLTVDVGEDVRLYGLAWSSDGRQIATAGSDGMLILWDAMTGAAMQTKVIPNDRLNACAFAPGNDRVALALEARRVAVWRPARPEAVGFMQGHTDRVTDCAFTPDGSLSASAAGDMTLKIWHGDPLLVVDTQPSASIHACAVGTDFGNTLLVGDDHGTLWWVTERGWIRLHDLESTINSLDIAGRAVVCGGRDGSVVLSHGATVTLRESGPAVRAVIFAPDGETIAVGAQGDAITFYAVATGQQSGAIAGKFFVRGLAYSPDGRVLAAALSDGTCLLWQDGQFWDWRAEHERPVTACQFSPDGTILATASADRTLKLWDYRRGALLHTCTGHTDTIYSCAFAPSGGSIITVSRDRTLRLWDVGSGHHRTTFHAEAGFFDCDFHPDGERIAAVGLGGVYWLRIEW